MKILLAGESWTTVSTHIKGFDTFTTSVYEEGCTEFLNAIHREGIEYDFIPNHLAATKFPNTLEEMNKYDVIVLSDIGANTLLLPPSVFNSQQKHPNRLNAIAEWVKQGGSFLMVGGYLSFQGIEAKAQYHRTAIENILPVELLEGDDRVEAPQGMIPHVEDPSFFSKIDAQWPSILGYQVLVAKKNTKTILTIGEQKHPLLVVGEIGKGRSAAFATDMGPHWLSKEFMDWQGYSKLWLGILSWLVRRK
ncbi:MAG: glutamine amidotransferase [Bifidobacterium aquikefiri]|uniref:Cytoplasmic protein n=1 Tax=Bifidobacterium aquikefiri TaxID=1653207 RepID=A0A261G645_9BIFI|nr:glutamine amidotransferase [Bifidobacterium aquikefiri]OZG66899.1 cytoplasmic protein [Bifidobacterium aquikefiri]